MNMNNSNFNSNKLIEKNYTSESYIKENNFSFETTFQMYEYCLANNLIMVLIFYNLLIYVFSNCLLQRVIYH